MSHSIEIRSLTKRYGDVPAVSDLSLDVPTGSVFGYLGLNGAGKSTTIRMLTTLIEPTSGTAIVGGRDVVKEAAAVRSLIGLVGDQGAESRPAWTPREYVRYFAALHGLDDLEGEVSGVFDLVNLPVSAMDRRLGACSTGTRRRVDIARALIGRPRILFLDEPTRGLDLPSRLDLWDKLRDLVAQTRMTVFLSSHDAREVQALCDRLTVINRGRVTFTGTPADMGERIDEFETQLARSLLERPRTTFTVERVSEVGRS